MRVNGRGIAGQLERVKQRRPRFGPKRGRCIVIEIDSRSRHRAFRVMQQLHGRDAGCGTLSRGRNQTLLEILRPTSLQGALQPATERPETRFEQF